tara:strand:+ start:1199 stop:1618 length:420 start_codon:yes stop_codon:yes gene_type:complete
MPVQSEWFGDKFEEMFAKAIGQELVKSAKILRRNLSTVLATTGKSPPSSPKGSDIPYNRTGTLARSWHASATATRRSGKLTAGVGTNVLYAWDLIHRADSGRRNYMNENLYWYQKTTSMILKRLEPQRLIKSATRNFRF